MQADAARIKLGRIHCGNPRLRTASFPSQKTSIMLFIIIGIILLYFGAEGLVRSSASLATRLGISPLIAGLTIVAFGTSAPELSVSLSAALGGNPDIAMGNVVGSNIFNIAVILGIAALIMPIKVQLSVIRRDIPVMIACSLAAFALIAYGEVTRLAGMLLFLGLAFYVVMAIRSEKRETGVADAALIDPPPLLSKNWLIDAAVLLVGLGILILGSQLFVDGATSLAEAWGVSDAIIGLTVVAAGTSLPELATSIVAAVRKQSDIAIGNIVGSNIFNVLCILGVTATVSPIHVSGIGMLDAGVMIFLSILLLPFAFTQKKISRVEGTVFLGIYGVYLFLLWP